MSEAATPRFAVELRSPNSSAVAASATYDDPGQALQAYRDAAEAFRAAKMPAGASLSLNDQKLELHGGAVSEGKGTVLHSWSKTEARERFDQLEPSKVDRPEQAALREAFAGKAAEVPKTEALQIDPADLQRVAAARDRDTAQARESLAPGSAKAEASREARGGSMEGVERTNFKDAGVKDAGTQPSGPKGSPVDAEERQDALRKRYLRTAEGYHDKQTMELVIHDKGNRLSSPREDLSTVDAMATAAADRGWVSVNVTGTDNFKREAWYQLSVRGIEVTGYSPSPVDKERLAEVQRSKEPESRPYTDNVIQDVQRRERERKGADKEAAPAAKAAPDPSLRSPTEEAAKAVRLVASDLAVEGGTSTPREQLAVSAAANNAYDTAVNANARDISRVRAVDKETGVSAPVPASPARAAARPLSSGQEVMVAAVDRALREGGMSAEQRARVQDVVKQNVAEKNPTVQVPKVADRAAIPQPAASPAPQKQAKRDLSR